MPQFRELKSRLKELLEAHGWRERLAELDENDPAALVCPLMGFLHRESPLRWRAATAMGAVVDRMAGQNMESARVVLRRLMWNLNEESGGLGWGSPEAMAEILARNEKLAQEFGSILLSYIHDSCKADNFLDHAPLRVGAFWGIARFAQAWPEMAAPAEPALLCGLDNEDIPAAKGYAAWALGLIPVSNRAEAAARLRRLQNDATTVELYRNEKISHPTLGDLAAEALQALGES